MQWNFTCGSAVTAVTAVPVVLIETFLFFLEIRYSALEYVEVLSA
jgi:hypothetical protein